MMKNVAVVGLLASGAATLALIISIGINDTTSEWNVLVCKFVPFFSLIIIFQK